MNNTIAVPSYIDEPLSVTGMVRIVLTDENGFIKEDRTVKNLVVTAGKNFIASRLTGTSSAVMGWMEVGTSTQTAVIGDTTLVLPVASSRTALTSMISSTNTVTFICTFPATKGTGALTEAGIFNASSGGTMLCRTLFSVVNKSDSDSITVTWVLTIA